MKGPRRNAQHNLLSKMGILAAMETTPQEQDLGSSVANAKQQVLICANPLARMLMKTSYFDMFRDMWTRFLGSC
jgi:hypothetical protein